MAYGICRIKKLKVSSLKACDQHVQRQRFTPNADPSKENVCILGQNQAGTDLETLVRERIGKQTIRKNAVMAVELLLSASPEYFRPNNKSEAGYWDKERLEDFQDVASLWLTECWGEGRIVRAELHLDEATPHIHAFLVPLDDKGKLNCRGLFGTKLKLSQLQDSYAKAMSTLGLERGIRGSKATHTQIKQYYTAVTQFPDLSLDAATIQHQLADRKRILKAKTEMELTAKALSKKLEAKEYRNLELEVSLEASQQQLDHWQRKYQNLNKNTEFVPLQIVAWELGLSPIDGQPDQWGSFEQVFKITDTSFSLPNSTTSTVRQSSSALDLVMRVNNCDFQEATIWLNDRFGEVVALQAADYHTKQIIKQEAVPKFKLPTSEEKHWLQVRTYLLEEMKLSSSLINKLHLEGLIYADNKQNLVCTCRTLANKSLTGATLHRTNVPDKQFTSLAAGSKRLGGYFYFESGGDLTQPLERVAVVDTPINALSMATLDNPTQKTMYVSLNGNQPPYDFLRSLPAKSVLIALNHNPNSEKIAHQIRQQLPKQTLFKRPTSVDWNTELRKASEQKQKQLEPKQQLHLRLDRGLTR
jgi:Plasmid recombination enzyme